jgi:carbamoyl-phosphate synthase large subunit
MRSAPTVVVTGVGGGGVGEQILKALRLSELDYEVVGTDVTALSKGLYEVDHAYIVPSANDPGYVDAVLRVCEKHDASVLLCGSEPELKAWSQHRDEVSARGIMMPINPPSVLDLCLDKLKTSSHLAGLGFRVPRWRAIRGLDDLALVDSLPAVLKPSTGGGGSVNLHIAQSTDDLQTLGRYLLEIYPEFIVQEYVGTPESEYTVGVLNTLEGAFVNSIALRRHLGTAISTRIRVRNHTGREELGDNLVISSGFSHGTLGKFPAVTATCEQVAAALGVTGPVNIQCRLVGEEVVIFEINPRFSGTTSLRAMVGYNEPDVLIRHHILGEPVEPRFPYREGTILRGLHEQLIPEVTVPRA